MYEPATSVYPTTKKCQSLILAEALETEITELCAHINAASYRLLQLVAALDDEGPWGSWGLNSCAHWLNWRCGIGMNAAREKVRVAHALKPLPLISASFATGELSFSKVRALTRIADTDNEAKLLDLARHATAAQVEKLVRAYRRVGRLEESERATAQHASRELTYYYDDDGSLVIRARLPADEGAVVLQALNAAMDAQACDVESDDVNRGHAYPVEFGTHYILCFVCTMIVSALRKAGPGQKRRLKRNTGCERGNEEHRMEPRQQVLASTVKNRSRSQAGLVAVSTFNQSFAIEWPATLNSAPRTDKSVRISNPEKQFFTIRLSAKSVRELT